MLSLNQIKYVNALKIKKYRHKQNAFIVEGEKCVNELLESNLEILNIFGLPEWITQKQKILQKKDIQYQIITHEELKKISDLTTPNRVLATAKILEHKKEPNLSEMILALDNIKDPGNMGTMVRTAEWFGITQILCSQNCVDFYNPKVIQATMGTFARVGITYLDLDVFLKDMDGKAPVYGALVEGPSIANATFIRKGIILIGSESHGISKNLLHFVDTPVHIPHFTGNTSIPPTESLNASVASAIICYEVCKQIYKNKHH